MSAQKFYLVESQKYNALLNDYDPDHVKIAQKDVQDILTDPKLDVSAKNALFTSKMRNYLQKLKHSHEKPVTVKLEDGPNDLEQAISSLVDILKNPPPHLSVPKKKAIKRKFSPEFEQQKKQKQDFTPLSTQSEQAEKDDPSSFITPQNPKQIPMHTPKIPPQQKMRSPNISRNASIHQKTEDKIDDLTNYLMQNKQKFSLNSAGQVLGKNRKVVEGSSHQDIARYLIEGSTGHHTPKGYKIIQNALSDDPKVKSVKFGINKWS